MIDENLTEELKKSISQEKKIVGELTPLFEHLRNVGNTEEKSMISSQINSLKNSLKKTNENVLETLKKMYIARPLVPVNQKVVKQEVPKTVNPQEPVNIVKPQESVKAVSEPPKMKKIKKGKLSKELKPSELEMETLKRLAAKEKKTVIKKEKKPSGYVKKATKTFFRTSVRLADKKMFQTLERELTKANLQFTPETYISIILFTTLLSVFVGLLIFLFVLFFNFGAELPIVTRATGDIGARLLKVFWILLVVPLGTFLAMYVYPSLEKKVSESRINQELPFATIHMAAISGSMIDPSKMFNIIVSTKEYPYLEKEFTKLINEINVYGYDFVSALRNSASNSPSKKLSELFNGLATTISSGGDLPKYFEKRSETLLFEYRIEREKYTKAAETFMDIYISIVIAAPMILMLLLMMMKVGGLGISLSTSTITLMMVLGITIINFVFITFLHLKKSAD